MKRVPMRWLCLIAGMALSGWTGCSSGTDSGASDVQAADSLSDDVAAGDQVDLTGDQLGEDTHQSSGQFTEAQQSALQAILDDYIRFSEEPSIALALEMGDRRWSGYAGYTDLVAKTPVTSETRFRVGSNTKPMTATWILMLVEEGKVDLDESVTTYLPQYPQFQAMKVRHLLGMESGLPELLSAPTTLLTVLSNPDSDFTPAEVLDFVKDVPVLFAPGEGCSYSNTDFVVLGMIGEAVTGNRAVDELKTRIFDPLGMTETYLEMTGDPTEHLAHGYMDLAVLGPLLKLPPIMLGLFDKKLFVGDSLVVDATTLLPPSLTWTAGSIVSVPGDLAKFQRALQTGKLLKPETVEQMRQVQPCDLFGGTVQYGLGMMRLESAAGPVFGHGGLNFGFHVETWYVPSLDVAYSHTHNVLPAEVVTVNEQAISVANNEEVPASCEIPDQLLDQVNVDKPYLKMRFKGTVGDGTAEQHISGAGMSSIWVDLGEGASRFFGFDCLGIYSAANRTEQGGVDTFSVSAWGPSDANATYLRRLRISMAATQLEATGDDGYASLDFADATRPFPVVLELALNEVGFQWDSECIVAVPDPALASQAYLCDGKASVQVGQMIRMGLVVGLTTDDTAIDSYLASAGRDRCICFDEGNNPITCP